MKEISKDQFVPIIDKVSQFSQKLSSSLVNRILRRYRYYLATEDETLIPEGLLTYKLQLPFWNLYCVLSSEEESEVLQLLRTNTDALQLFSYMYVIVDWVMFFFLNLPLLSVEFVFANPERRRVIRDSVFPLLTLNFLLLYNAIEKFFYLTNLGDYFQAVRNYIYNNINQTLMYNFFHYLEMQFRHYDSEKGLALLQKYSSNFTDLKIIENPGRIYLIFSDLGGDSNDRRK
jgi:hypothetical protein